MISIKLFWTYAIVSCGTFFCDNDGIQQAGLHRQLREKELPDLKYCRSIFDLTMVVQWKDLPHKHMELSPCSPKKVYCVELGGIFMFIIDRNIVWHSCPYCLCGHHGNHYCICLSPSGSSNSCFVGFYVCAGCQSYWWKKCFHENQYIKQGQIISTGLCLFLLASILLSSLVLAGCHVNTSQGYGLVLVISLWTLPGCHGNGLNFIYVCRTAVVLIIGSLNNDKSIVVYKNFIEKKIWIKKR